MRQRVEFEFGESLVARFLCWAGFHEWQVVSEVWNCDECGDGFTIEFACLRSGHSKRIQSECRCQEEESQVASSIREALSDVDLEP